MSGHVVIQKNKIIFPIQLYDATWQSTFNQIMTLGILPMPPTKLKALC
jgi:hypothetical protein